MRLVPFLTAVVVTAFLYFLVFEREALMEMAGITPQAENSETAPTAAADTETTDSTAIRVIAKRSVAETIDSAVLLRGQTRAMRQVDVRSETSGRVISEPLRKGTMIEAGQLLCEIDIGTREISLAEAQARLADARSRIPETEARVPEAEARQAEALARLEEARINANAADKLSEGGFASETRVVNAKAAVSSAEAAVKAAEAGLKSASAGMETVQASIQSAQAAVAAAAREIERLTIRAPFAGVLESDTAELGSLLQPGSLCATVVQLNPIKVEGFAPEADINRIAEGAPATAMLIDGTEITGNVSFLARSADPATRTFLVEIEVPNAELSIRDGQTAELVIASDGLAAHLLPQSALTLNNDGDLGVRVVTDQNTARFTPVALLRDTVDGVWLGGLPQEASVILVGQEFVTDGVAVEPFYEEVVQ
jgi:multidrug efflux system membrane fusion protein